MLVEIASRFGGKNTPTGLPRVMIGTTGSSASRLVRLYGTMSGRSAGTDERPQRRSELLGGPGYRWPKSVESGESRKAAG